MNRLPHTTLGLATASALALALLSACNKPADQAPAPAPADTAAATPAAVPAEAADGLTTEQYKAIAEEGFIFGLPLAMNYAIMNEYAVDKNTDQYKAPFNQIKNESRVYTYKRLADPLHPEGFAGQGQGIELAASTERPDLPGIASVLAESGH